MPKADPTRAFFEALAERGHEPLLGMVTGTLRIEVVDGETSEHWHVDVQKGAVKVSRKNVRADAVVRIPRPLCDKISSGEENAMAAMLRGELVPEGDLRLIMLFQRLFPGPPSTQTSRSGR
jgi:hypothetical protein